MSNSVHRLVVIDSDKDFFARLGLLIKGTTEFTLVNRYENVSQMLSRADLDRPEVIMMDVDPDELALVRTRVPNAQIIIFSDYDDVEIILESFRCGAVGYISKKSAYMEVLDALQKFAAGGAAMTGRIARVVVESFQVNIHSPLTKRESEILRRVAKGETASLISEHLFISVETTKTHIKNIYKKLSAKNRAQAVDTAIRDKLI
jgi:DNA-binding NarL/FixJ family response regulator